MKYTMVARRITENHYELTYTERRWFRRPVVEIAHAKRQDRWYYLIDGLIDTSVPISRAVEKAIDEAKAAEEAERRAKARAELNAKVWRPAGNLPKARVIK